MTPTTSPIDQINQELDRLANGESCKECQGKGWYRYSSHAGFCGTKYNCNACDGVGRVFVPAEVFLPRLVEAFREALATVKWYADQGGQTAQLSIPIIAAALLPSAKEGK